MGVLNKTKTYLIGPMQYANGREWREDMSEFLGGLGITPLDPYKKPFVNSVDEDEEVHRWMDEEVSNGRFEKVCDYMKTVRSFDLSMVDKSDFLICLLDPSVPTFGTMEELSWAVRMKRPVFIAVEGGKKKTPLWVLGMLPEKYIYNNFEEIKMVIKDIDSGEKTIDSDRWRLFREELR